MITVSFFCFPFNLCNSSIFLKNPIYTATYSFGTVSNPFRRTVLPSLSQKQNVFLLLGTVWIFISALALISIRFSRKMTEKRFVVIVHCSFSAIRDFHRQGISCRLFNMIKGQNKSKRSW